MQFRQIYIYSLFTVGLLFYSGFIFCQNDISYLQNELKELESQLNEVQQRKRSYLEELSNATSTTDEKFPLINVSEKCLPLKQKPLNKDSKNQETIGAGDNPCNFPNDAYQRCICETNKSNDETRRIRESEITILIALLNDQIETSKSDAQLLANQITELKEKLERELVIVHNIPDERNITNSQNGNKSSSISSQDKETNDWIERMDRNRKRDVDRYLNDNDYQREVNARIERERQEQQKQDMWLMENMPLQYAINHNLNAYETQMLLDLVYRYKEAQIIEERRKKKLAEKKIIEEKRKKELLKLEKKKEYAKKAVLEFIENGRQKQISFLTNIHNQITKNFRYSDILSHIVNNMEFISSKSREIQMKNGDINSFDVNDFYLSRFKIRLVDYYYITGSIPTYLSEFIEHSDADIEKELNDYDYDYEFVTLFLTLYPNHRLNRYSSCVDCPILLNINEINTFIEDLNTITNLKFRLPSAEEYLVAAYDNQMKPSFSEEEMNLIQSGLSFHVDGPNGYTYSGDRLGEVIYPPGKYGLNKNGIADLYFGVGELYTNKILIIKNEKSLINQDQISAYKNDYIIPFYLSWVYQGADDYKNPFKYYNEIYDLNSIRYGFRLALDK